MLGSWIVLAASILPTGGQSAVKESPYLYLKCVGPYAGDIKELSGTRTEIFVKFNKRHFYYFENYNVADKYEWGNDLCRGQNTCDIDSDHILVSETSSIDLESKDTDQCDELNKSFSKSLKQEIHTSCNDNLGSGQIVKINRVNGKLELTTQYWFEPFFKDSKLNEKQPYDKLNIFYGTCESSKDPMSVKKF